MASARVAHMGFESPTYRACPAQCTVHGALGIEHHQELTSCGPRVGKGLSRAGHIEATSASVSGSIPFNFVARSPCRW
jgi:hypothetical protein